MKYLATDGRLSPFHPGRCDEWPIVEPTPHDRSGLGRGVYRRRLYLTPDGRWIDRRWEYLPEREYYDGLSPWTDVAEEIADDRARDLLRGIGEEYPEASVAGRRDGPHNWPHGLPPIVCSQAKLAGTKSVGRSGHYSGLLKRLKDTERVARYEAAVPGKNPRLWKIWMADPAEHRRVQEELRCREDVGPA